VPTSSTAPFPGAVGASGLGANRRRRPCPTGPPLCAPWYYLGCYLGLMVTKRSVSLADEVATAVETAAEEDGMSFSAWLSSAAERQLRVRRGLRGVADWEEEAGALTAEEIANGEALLARLFQGVSGVASRVRRR